MSLAQWPCRLLGGREPPTMATGAPDGIEGAIVRGLSLPLHRECFWRWGGVRFVTLLANQGNAEVRINARSEKPQP